ncbi:DUF2207 domain-containing protein [Mycetocola zhadangensis]|uniref:DUF2207 domain-containing protein n=1 Tax=Mycetocola zhadangensis TaxID=1164595 RepID=A0A3L7J148_9MICO|nr:DUF2207 domain-containing protein [Mycetocola zhadangensis]RLQ84154.1 DUF2207 domain-containing protein [Mycetocola zhadangensis]GGE95666.1 hypothetical protein GCM10011313_18300 [Mycetocola zhadangensis]
MMLVLVLVFLTLPTLALLAIAITARATGRALPKPRVVEYVPPKGVPVLDAALLSGNEKRGIAAALIGMAVDRKIRLLAEPDKKAPVAVEVQPHAVFTIQELGLLDALFGPGHSSSRVRRFSKDRRAQSAQLAKVLAAAESYLRSYGLIGPLVKWRLILLRVCAGIFLLFALFVALGAGGNGEIAAMYISLLTAGIALASMIVAPGKWRRYGEPSALLREQLAGLNGYISLAEADRLRFLQSPSGALRTASGVTAAGLAVGVGVTGQSGPSFELDRLILNERLLPYAILFGHSEEWLAELRVSYNAVGATDLQGVGAALDVAADLLLLASVVGNLAELAFALGDAVDAGGAVFEAVGAFADLFDGL